MLGSLTPATCHMKLSTCFHLAIMMLWPSLCVALMWGSPLLQGVSMYSSALVCRIGSGIGHPLTYQVLVLLGLLDWGTAALTAHQPSATAIVRGFLPVVSESQPSSSQASKSRNVKDASNSHQSKLQRERSKTLLGDGFANKDGEIEQSTIDGTQASSGTAAAEDPPTPFSISAMLKWRSVTLGVRLPENVVVCSAMCVDDDEHTPNNWREEAAHSQQKKKKAKGFGKGLKGKKVAKL